MSHTQHQFCRGKKPANRNWNWQLTTGNFMGQSTLANERKQLGTAGSSSRAENSRVESWESWESRVENARGGGRRPENCGVHQKLAEGNASVLRQQLHHQNNKFSRNLETLGQLLKSALLIDVECCGFGYDIWYQNTTNSSSPRGRRW